MKNINSFKIDRNLDPVEQNKILKNFIENFSNKFFTNIDFSSDNTSTILNTSIVTHYKDWNRETEFKLSNILKRYKQENNVG